MAAQCSQAAASFTLQVVAVRLLGLEGLGRFAALYAVLVLATAVSSGFVGDSLTVLDRSAASVRAGLQTWTAVVTVGAGTAAGLAAVATGVVDGPTAAAFAVATALFLLGDVLRRLLMAALTFWRIVAVDLLGLAGTAVTLVVAATAGADLALRHLFWALAGGQAVAVAVAVVLLPSAERFLSPWSAADLRVVAGYGWWRAVQQAVRPAQLAAVRSAVIVLVSVTAAGELEAARVYVAPAMIVVGGVSSVLFAGYAVRRAVPLTEQLRATDRAVTVLVAAVAALGAVAVLALPWAGVLLTGDGYALSAVAVVGWAGYAAATAAGTPYGALAAVRGRQAAVLLVRVAESVLALAVVVLVLRAGAAASWVPLVLTAGALLGALAFRALLTHMPDHPALTGPAPTPAQRGALSCPPR